MYHRGEIARVKNFPRVALYIYRDIEHFCDYHNVIRMTDTSSVYFSDVVIL